MEEYGKVKKHLKKGKASGRDNLPAEVFIEGGQKLEESVVQMFNLIKAESSMPHQWTQVQISTMYKNKGPRKRLVNQRGIFLKQILSKMYGKLNMNRAAEAMQVAQWIGVLQIKLFCSGLLWIMPYTLINLCLSHSMIIHSVLTPCG